MSYSLYIVQCADGTLYTGIAIDVARRLMEHNGELVGKTGAALKSRGARYTAARRPVRLVYQTEVGSRSAAMKAEIATKRLSKAEKQRLIGEDIGSVPSGALSRKSDRPQEGRDYPGSLPPTDR